MKLIKINTDHYVVVDDSEIQEGDWMIRNGEQPILVTPNFWWDFAVPYKKITHSTRPIEDVQKEYPYLGHNNLVKHKGYDKIKPLSLSEVKELIGEVDVEKRAEKFIGCKYDDIEDNIDQIGYDSFIRGYKQALEDNKEKKYTEEDIRKAIEMARDIKDDSAHDIFTAEDISGCAEVCTYGWRNRYKDEEIIQSIQPKTEWEVEIIDGKLKLNK